VLGGRGVELGPDDTAHDRGVSEELLLGRGQQVDPRDDDPEDAVGQPFDVTAGRTAW
jgi:hypothetical protein